MFTRDPTDEVIIDYKVVHGMFVNTIPHNTQRDKTIEEPKQTDDVNE